MTFYTRDITKTCQWLGCSRAAKVAVQSSGTSHFGDYCKRHGRMRVRELQGDAEVALQRIRETPRDGMAVEA